MARLDSREHDTAATEALGVLSFPPFRFDPVNRQLWCDGKRIVLKPKALGVLHYLLLNPRRLVTKAELLANVWSGVHVSDAVIKTQLSDIRLALGDRANSPRFIETAHGRGYRFLGEVYDIPAAPAAVEAAPSSETFVGREAELSFLERAFADAAAGRRRLVFVAGPPGIGKTSLVEAFSEGLSRRVAVTFARGQCVNQSGVTEAYLPMLEALGRLGRARERSALAAVLRRYAPTWLSQLPGLSEGDDSPVQPTVGLIAAPERMMRELAEALEAFALDKPLLLLFEDVHWADPSTLAWMAYVARRPDPTRLMLLATFRPLEVDAAAHSLGTITRDLALQQRCQELTLPSFVGSDIEAYLARRFGAHRLPPALTELLLARTGGSPLFLTKLLDSWIERDLIRPGSDGWGLAVELDALRASTTPSVVSLIEHESNRLTLNERMVVEAASVAGHKFSAAAVSAALRQELVEIEDVCLRLARRGQFIREAGAIEWPDGTLATQCEFIHEIHRHTTYERIGAARKAQLHQRIGEREEAGYGPRAKEIAVELALHFQRGGDRKRAHGYWGAAGEQALARSAYHEAVENFEQALTLLSYVEDEQARLRLELELQVAVGGALAMTRGHGAPEVERRYARARQLCRELGETQYLTQTLASILIFYLVRGDYRTVCELGQASLSLVGRTQDEQAGQEANVVVGVAQAFMGELSGARARLDRAIELHRSGLPVTAIHMLDTGAIARTMGGVTLWLLGYPDQALQLQLETLALGERLHDACAIALASTTLTLVLQLRGESSELLDRLDAAVGHCQRYGFVYYLANLRVLGGFSAATQSGDWKERLGEIAAAWEAVRATGSEFGDTRLCALVAGAHARAGLHGEAFRLLERALERVASNAEHWWEPELYRMLGELVIEADAVPPTLASRWGLPLAVPQCTEACFGRALEVARRIGAKSLELRAALALARWWRTRGRPHEAGRLLHGIYAWFTEGFDTRDLTEARELLRALAAEPTDSKARAR